MSDFYNGSSSSTTETENASNDALGTLEPPTAVPSLDLPVSDGGSTAAGAEKIADGVKRRLHPSWITASRLRGLISSAVLVGLLGVGWVTVGLTLGHWLLASVVWIVLALLLLVRAILWPKLAWRYYAYAVAPRGLRIRRGVLVRSILSVPKTRVQHTDVSQGPLQRHFGIATLTVHTAGTQYAAVSLPGVPYGTALAIRNYLIDDDEDEDGDGV